MIVNDLLSRLSVLMDERQRWESLWLDIADYTDPMSSLAFEMGRNRDTTWQRSDYGASSERGSRRRYDNTAITSCQRLSAYIESLLTPQAEKWHDIEAKDVFAGEPDEATDTFYRNLRDYMFKARYDARAGFVTANQHALGAAVRYGTGVSMVEEAFGYKGGQIRDLPFRYRVIPLPECFIALNAYGTPDTLFRRFSLTARQIVHYEEKAGWKVHERIRRMAEKPSEMDRRFTILHAVMPREEKGSKEGGQDDREFASYYVDCDNRHLMSDSGFFEFPYAVFHWNSDGMAGYGESPVMSIIDDVRGLNHTVFNARRAMAKKIDPAYFIQDEGVLGPRPNLNPGKHNFGRFDANGRLMFQTVSPDVSLTELANMIEADRAIVKDGMHLNLFNILTQNPGMTATEAMLRSNEKAELLGPSGTRLQSGLAHTIDIEASILARHGAFDLGSPLEAPEALAGKEIQVRFTAPIDRLRKAQEALGVQNLLQAVAALAQMGKTEALDRIDTDTVIDIMREAQGVSRAALRGNEDVEAERQQRGQLQQIQQVSAVATQAGQAGNEILPALAGMSQLQAIAQP